MEHTIQPEMSMSVAVIEAVSDVEGCPPTELPRLSNAVDPDALDNLFTQTGNSGTERDSQLSFVFSNCRVTIENGETITVDPQSPARMSA